MTVICRCGIQLWYVHRAAMHLPIDIISGSAASGHSAHVDEAERRRRETNLDDGAFAIYARLTRDSKHVIVRLNVK
jgi:hypothetical protein